MNLRNQIRQQIRKKRQNLTEKEQSSFSAKLTQLLATHSKVISANNIAIYLPNDGELSTLDFIEWCWEKGKTVYLPVIHPFTKGHLLFIKYQQNTLMKNNVFGIPEPKLDVREIIPTSQLDIIFTPLVAFDRTGARLGMGGGFYDRTLANLYHSQPNKSATIGLAHNCQQIEKVPTEHWDIPIDEIITPDKVFVT
mgnify:CR=1 FL=1